MEDNIIKVSDEVGAELFEGLDLPSNEQPEVISPEPTSDPIVDEPEKAEEQKVELEPELEKKDEPEQVIIPEEPEFAPVVQDVEKKEEKVPNKIKKQIFKDEQHAAINKYIEENGTENVKRFVEIYNSNFDGLSAEELVRQRILNDPDNAGISSKLTNRLLEQEIAKYNLDSDDDDEVAIGKEMLERDARAIKRTLEAQRDEFRTKYKAEIEVEVDEYLPTEQKEPTEAEIAEREAKKQSYLEMFSPFVKDGVMKLQDKEGFVSIPVKDINAIAEAAVNPTKFLADILIGQDGKPNLASFAELVAFATNRNGFKSALISYGNTRGASNIVSELKNEVPLGKPRQVVEPKGPIDVNNLPDDFFEHVKVVERRV